MRFYLRDAGREYKKGAKEPSGIAFKDDIPHKKKWKPHGPVERAKLQGCHYQLAAHGDERRREQQKSEYSGQEHLEARRLPFKGRQ